jgi:hypothetical protein
VSSEPRCPVCGRRAGRQPTCAECGWVLHTRPLAGPVTPALKQEFDTQLSRAMKARAERDARTLSDALGEVITGLRAGRETAVIEVGPERIELTFAFLDAAQSPQVRPGWKATWASLVPNLPSGQQARQTQLSAGQPGLNNEHVAKLVRARLPAVGGAGALVVCRPAGWQVLEAAGRAAAQATRPAARLLPVAGGGTAPVRTLLAAAAASAALRQPYYLLTATVNATTGEVRLRPRRLFAAGAKPGTSAQLPLRRMPGDLADTTLAVFAGDGVTDWSTVEPLALFEVPVPADPQPQARVRLAGPGRVELTAPAQAKPLSPGSWAKVCRQMPRRVATTASPVDLVCAVDLSGDFEAVRLRKNLAGDLIQLLDNEYQQPGQLRVAIVTCTDHVFGADRGAEFQPVTDTSRPVSAADALRWLAAKEGVNPLDRHCAPVEDLLDEACFLLKHSAPNGRRPRLLTLAGRPPHPFPQRGGRMVACPRRISWEQVVRDLDAAKVRYAVITDARPNSRDPDQGLWTRLGPAGRYELAAASTRQVAEGLGLLAAPDQRIPIPLSEDS